MKTTEVPIIGGSVKYRSLEAKDLRIGNKLLFDNDVHTVRAIYTDDEDLNPETISTDKFDREERISHFQPIPLSDSILEKCGFVRQYQIMSFGRTIEETKMLENLIGESEEEFCGWNNGDVFIKENLICHGVRLKTVHQFQNLYFSLTGKELKIEL